jgi:hypothetical protein
MKTILKVAAMAAGFAMMPAAAQASTIMINSTGFDTPGYRTGKITYTPTATVLNNVGIGRLKLSGVDTTTMSAVQYLTFCVDIFHTLGAGLFTTPSLSTYITNPTKLAQLTTLVGNADALIASAGTAALRKDRSAAAQLAVWEIVYENSGLYNVTAGQFNVMNGDSAAARTIANTWLGNVSGGSWTAVANKRLGFLYSATNQSQIYLTNVPEPATWAMMLVGFGFVGRALRNQSRRGIVRTVLA